MKIETTYYPLILVKDLRTNFILGKNLAVSVTSAAVKEALVNAKSVAHMCPSLVARAGFKHRTIHVHFSIENQENLMVARERFELSPCISQTS